MHESGSYDWVLEPDVSNLRSASDEKAWLARHYDEIHELCLKAQTLIEQGASAPEGLVVEMAEYGLRYCKGMSPCLDTQRGVYTIADVTSADHMLDIHRNYELRRQGLLGDDEWLGAISYAAWNFMTRSDGRSSEYPDHMIMRQISIATTSFTVSRSAEHGWHGQAGDHPQNARVRLRLYENADKVLQYKCKVPPRGGFSITLDTAGSLPESAKDGFSGMEVDRIVDDPILNGSGIRIGSVSSNDERISVTTNEKDQNWYPVIFGACQVLAGIKKVALREYRQATA